jgi:hypothetical protein
MSHPFRTFLVISAAPAVLACGEDSASLQATPGVEITLTPAELVLTIGGSAPLQVTVQDHTGRLLSDRVVEWSSSAPDIAAVTETGLVLALASGIATIGAYSDQSVGFARVAVQPGFVVPLPGEHRALVVTEIGTPSGECPGNEGGLRMDGSRDCSHAGISRFSLDLADAAQWNEGLAGSPAPDVIASAEGTIKDVCLQPPTEVTCGSNGPFVLIEHPGGFSSIYAHLDPGSVILRRKTPVRGGQRLGVMGSWGADRSPWLHFELRVENQGAEAAWVLDALQLSGQRLSNYHLGPVPAPGEFSGEILRRMIKSERSGAP